MGELLLLITIVTLVVLAIRRGSPVALDNPVIIHRRGQYHITLAPQLNRAQTFTEQIAGQFARLHPSDGHGRNAMSDETCHARFPLPNPLPEKSPPIQLSPSSGRKGNRERQSSTPAGEGANESLREIFVKGDLPTQYYEVRDPAVFARGESAYLLAITLRGGILYFQAINPQPLIYDADSHYKTLREFSGAVLKQHPPSKPADEQWAEKLRDSTGKIAEQLNITVEALQAD